MDDSERIAPISRSTAAGNRPTNSRRTASNAASADDDGAAVHQAPSRTCWCSRNHWQPVAVRGDTGVSSTIGSWQARA
jgi:hypothetical protein